MTFPKAIRDQLGLEAGDKLEFTIIENGQLLIIPKKSSVKALKGMLPKPKKAISLEEMDNAIAQGAAE
ncbi:MAG: AbrB/MazE/SpoVT family DNA-binding domain-containing protein [Cocleimonas sp.]|nr:AbrB/MazE/SpoVT family DNA-binding domain-containing protein [Cocleimonas sp.]